MAERVPPPLSPSAQQLLHAFRDDESPTELDRRRGLQSVYSRLEEEPASARAGQFYAKVIAVTVMLAAAVLLTLKFVGVGVTALTDQARQPAMEAPYQGAGNSEGGQAVEGTPPTPAPRRVVRGPVEHAVVVEPEPEPEVPAVAEPPPVATPPIRHKAPAAPSARAPTTAEDLQAELALIKRARDAEQRQRPAEGLAALAEHARRFPRGTLADERRVMKAELLCASGRTAEARALVRRFERQRAGSALAGRMSAVCSAAEG